MFAATILLRFAPLGNARPEHLTSYTCLHLVRICMKWIHIYSVYWPKSRTTATRSIRIRMLASGKKLAIQYNKIEWFISRQKFVIIVIGVVFVGSRWCVFIHFSHSVCLFWFIIWFVRVFGMILYLYRRFGSYVLWHFPVVSEFSVLRLRIGGRGRCV